MFAIWSRGWSTWRHSNRSNHSIASRAEDLSKKLEICRVICLLKRKHKLKLLMRCSFVIWERNRNKKYKIYKIFRSLNRAVKSGLTEIRNPMGKRAKTHLNRMCIWHRLICNLKVQESKCNRLILQQSNKKRHAGMIMYLDWTLGLWHQWQRAALMTLLISRFRCLGSLKHAGRRSWFKEPS